ncbi:MAG: Gldg family protein [Gammaproteobacteria bacterium]
MQPSIVHIARKETAAFFSSPAAFIFFGAFLLATLFIFFWVETFFARNIADIRPLFDWIPVLMIFLSAALTMRMWSEERRSGTLEFLLTQPVSPLRFVIGKFLACLALVAIALLLTLSVPVSVSILGNLDWGPVFGAYLATLLLGSAYISIGLAVSAKSDSQIVSLIVTVLICSALYLIGSDTLTSLLGNRASEIFKAVGSGSRFESITRGVIDLRDLYYYASIVGVFLSLNVFFLESGRWSDKNGKSAHFHWRAAVALLVLNFAAGNFWISKIDALRIDLTQGRIYSLSDVSRGYLQRLREPLLIRGYFSAKTHPLLAPLIPQLRDLIREYQIAGGDKVRVEFVDPQENPELEKEAGQKYGIQPVPFQITDKYQATLVNSYFDIVIEYGDQFQTLGFRDLIEIKSQTESDLDVQLRNPEYEITRGIKKALYEYQSGGNLFVNLKNPVRFTGYFSEDERLPESLILFKNEIQLLLEEISLSSNDKFSYSFIDPDAAEGDVAKHIAEQFGFKPMQASLFDTMPFYFYMLLESDGKYVQAPLPENLDKEHIRLSIEAAIKRFSPGFTKTVAFYAPPLTPPDPAMQRYRMPSGKQFRLLADKLQESHNVELTPLDNGNVPENADLLVIAAPTELTEKQLFAMDQFLMKGGTLLIASSPFSAGIGGGTITAAEHRSGIEDWLARHGIEIEKNMVLDPQNAMLPVPVNRDLGGFTIQEIQMLDYPYFIDIREPGLSPTSAITASVPQISMNWASPIEIDRDKNKNRRVMQLLKSSEKAWLSDSLDVLPDFEAFGKMGFDVAEKRGRFLLGAVIEGEFYSYFKDKESPLLTDSSTGEEEKTEVIGSVIQKSPESARIILFSSNEFLTDQSVQLAASAGGNEYLNSLELIENAVDWSLEDQGLLSIRSRSHYSRTLYPLSSGAQAAWEYSNYFFSLFGLFLIYLIYRRRRRKSMRHYRDVLNLTGGDQ